MISTNFTKMIMLLRTGIPQALFFVASLAARILLYAAVFFLAFSIADYFFQRKQFIDSLKMSKHEVKEEYKELEGDPKVKGQIRRRMRDILERNSIKNVPEADVVITNPTHFAVAMKYDAQSMPAPMVLAKGADLMAQRIKEVAREYDVPIIEDKPLARALYANVDLGEIIPDEYYTTMSLIFAQVYKINEEKGRN